MFKFLSKIILLLFLFWLTSSGFSFLAGYGLRKHSNFLLINEWQQIISGNIDSDIVVLGSSRAKKHYNPKIIENATGRKCFNLGIDGSKTVLQYAKWLTYIEKNDFPDIIIFNIEPGTLGKDDILFNKEQYLPFYQVSPLKEYLKMVVSPLEYYLPIYKYHGYPTLFFEGMRSTIMWNDGSFPVMDGFSGLPIQNHKENLKLNSENIINERDIGVGLHYLDKVVKSCKQQDSKLLLVYSPEYNYNKQKYTNIRAFNEALDTFIAYNDITFLDYRNDSISLQKELFYDADHLNRNGADVFSYQLSEYLEKMINGDK